LSNGASGSFAYRKLFKGIYENMKITKNEFYRHATMRICGSLNIHTALENFLAYTREYIPIKEVRLALYNPDLHAFQWIAISRHIESGKNPDPDDAGNISSLPMERKELWSQLWAEMPDIQIINRLELRPEVSELFIMDKRDLDVSMMILKLELEGVRVGFLVLSVNGKDQYSKEHASFLLLLNEPFAIAMKNALQHQELLRIRDSLDDDNRYLRQQIRELAPSQIIGANRGLKNVMQMVRQVANIDSPVLLLGETGVGKGVLANAIHYSSPRKQMPFVSVNCGSIPDSLFESELFGHEKGAFTGANARKKGRFERANTGTIFLDEIGELPVQAQVRLLHVFQEKYIERVGGTEAIPIDVRIISATNRNLQDMIKAGKFREDLWYRLNVFPIIIPPLRHRKEDIPEFVHSFIEKKTIEFKLFEKPKLASGAIGKLMGYDWPGNVRELENVIERALIRNSQGPLDFEDLIPDIMEQSKKHPVDVADRRLLPLDDLITIHIMKAIKQANGKISGLGGAADLLKINSSTLRKKMDKLKIKYQKHKNQNRISKNEK
jgi:transcriptional regulator with GAF, ATPase, and Fis domain